MSGHHLIIKVIVHKYDKLKFNHVQEMLVIFFDHKYKAANYRRV